MGATRFVAKNTLLLTLGLLLGRVLSLFVLKKMTPVLGPDQLGIWILATDLTTILLVVTNFGLNTLITREITRARAMTWPLLWAALRARWVIGLLCYLLLLIYLDLSGFAPLTRTAVLVTAVAVFVEATAMACDSVLQAHEKVQYQAAGQLASAVVYFGLAIWWLDAGHGLMGVVWANLISRIVRLMMMVPLMLHNTGPWHWRTADGEWSPGLRWMLKLGLPLFLSTTFGIIYYKIGSVLLVEMVGEAATGIYGLGARALDILMIGPNIFATALFPAMARYGTEAAEDATRMGERALRYTGLAVLPVTLFCMFVAASIIRWFDRGGDFPQSVLVLQIVVWGLPFQAANTIFNRILITANRERAFIAISLIALFANVSLNLLLIPRFSYYGTAVATVTSLAISSLLHWYFLRQTVMRPALRRALLGPIATLALSWFGASALAQTLFPAWGTGWFALPIQAGWTPFLAVTAAAGAFYMLLVFGLRVLSADDLRLLQQLGGRTQQAHDKMDVATDKEM